MNSTNQQLVENKNNNVVVQILSEHNYAKTSEDSKWNEPENSQAVAFNILSEHNYAKSYEGSIWKDPESRQAVAMDM
ncbi:hypothetical protein GWI33_013983 [Rhynchophorus ferrugineus]|uniref:Uncharacterized protein n=1 Tax=Rhynchophorus ferrugineus TaxID=354439 RepID=A0A834I5F1_RHYFE|nr:hypothetical protein GWI33_013983 [Rhynchophorus ferrugineus]